MNEKREMTDPDAPRHVVDLRVETISELAFVALACAQRGLMLHVSVRREDGAPLRPSEALKAISASDGVKARMLAALAPKGGRDEK